MPKPAAAVAAANPTAAPSHAAAGTPSGTTSGARPAGSGAGVPPRPPRPTPPSGPPPAPAFDWESLLGIKGAAWLGGIAVVISSIFFVKWGFEHGYFPPPFRIALLLLIGVGALAWAELSLRRGYATTANSVSGAGIAILYVAFYAGHSLYGLFALGLTFAMMALVTVVAGLLAIRYDALFTAVLGLLGGFATPLLLSTGRDNPIGLFSYVLLLNFGLMAVARQRRWHGLVMLGLAGTLIIEIGWFGRFMAPEKMFIGLLAFLLFGLLYLFLPLVSEDQEQERLVQAGAIGGVAPFFFALLLASQRAYVGEWPLLFGFLGLLDAALIAVALLRGRVVLLLSAALATALTLPVWAAQGLSRDRLWGPTLAAIALVALLNAPRRIASLVAEEMARTHARILDAAGLVAGAGLGFFGLVLVAQDLGQPPWAFLVLAFSLLAVLLERTGEDRLPGVMLLGSGALAILVQAWFFRSTTADDVLRNLGVPLLLGIALSLVSAVRHRAVPTRTSLEEDEGAAVLAVLVMVAGLFGCLGSSALGSDPRPLFAALGIAMLLLMGSALRRSWTGLVPLGLAASAVFATAWHFAYFRLSDLGAALPAYVLLYVAFLALPFLIPPPAAAVWRKSPIPWATSALAGPAFFFVLYDTWQRAWGKGWIGALPILQAALSTLALAGISRIFVARAGDREGGAERLRYLALFAAVALGFVATAIPIQLDRQWITIGWALEAAAVWWLYGMLPHWGLRRFGALLFTMVGVRLLLNFEVFHYQERGLPILNWLLYTYGVPALCCFVGAHLLRRGAARVPAQEGESNVFASAASFLGLVLVFALINLEIFDFFSTGRYVEFSFERRFERDLTLSAAWALYAIGLLVLGMWRGVKALRFVSLGILILTVGKVFLYDLSALEGLYRILSFLGLGISLILVSLLYQRFVFSREASQ
jgi:uncharacterized membrane protein